MVPSDSYQMLLAMTELQYYSVDSNDVWSILYNIDIRADILAFMLFYVMCVVNRLCSCMDAFLKSLFCLAIIP